MLKIFVKEVIPGAAGCASHATQVLRPRPYESLGKALFTRWAPRGVADGLGSSTFLTSRSISLPPALAKLFRENSLAIPRCGNKTWVARLSQAA